LSDIINDIKTPGMSIDEVINIANKEWEELSANIKDFYREKEVKLFFLNMKKMNDDSKNVSFLYN
jgi:hypothetical protein